MKKIPVVDTCGFLQKLERGLLEGAEDILSVPHEENKTGFDYWAQRDAEKKASEIETMLRQDFEKAFS